MAGERTIKARSSSKSSMKLYSSWFCPFAQRVWIALEEKSMPYTWVEINPYEEDNSAPGGYSKIALPLETKKKKYPEFVDCSPWGLVPALEIDGKKVCDSMAVLEFIDEFCGGPSLLGSDPVMRAHQRIWASFINDRVLKAFYSLLLSQDAMTQKTHQARLEMLLVELSQAMAPASDGPYFLGEAFGFVDVVFAPFYQRILSIAGHYRGVVLPANPDFDRLRVWWEATCKRPAVANTIVCEERLISSYSQYATNRATSDVAKLIRQTLTKHENELLPWYQGPNRMSMLVFGGVVCSVATRIVGHFVSQMRGD